MILLKEIKCPSCGADIKGETKGDTLFCKYCGQEIKLNNENEYIQRNSDEIEIKKLEMEQLIYLKELDIKEKEKERTRKGQYIAYAIAGVVTIVGVVFIYLSHLVIGIILLIIALLIAFFALGSGEMGKENSLAPYEVNVNAAMLEYKDRNYNSITALYKSIGFTNITTIPLCDLKSGSDDNNENVVNVLINGVNDFKVGDVFKKADIVVISYHSPKQ